ncbi:MAG: hypothetical protein C4293_16700 [Nitrospiraceae bacterium]
MTILEHKNQCKDTLPLNATALEILTSKARRQIQEAGSEGPSGFVFANKVGNRMDARNLLRAFYTACQKAKLQGFRFGSMTSGTPGRPGWCRTGWTSTRFRSWGRGRRSQW